MDRWTQGSIAVGMDGQTGDLVDRLTVIEGPVASQVDRWTDKKTCRGLEGCLDGWAEGQMNGQTSRWSSGWIDG